MDDLISRSELIAQLERRMVHAVDPVVKVLFARMIELVGQQPTAELVPAEDRYCDNCKHHQNEPWEHPCKGCVNGDDGPSRWRCIVG